MIAEVEQHEYVPDMERKSAMNTDPQCEVCGLREDNPVHWQKFPVRNCSEPWPHKAHTICFRDDWTKTWQCLGVDDLSYGNPTRDALFREVDRVESLIDTEPNLDTKHRLAQYRERLMLRATPRTGRMQVTPLHPPFNSKATSSNPNPVLIAFRADYDRLKPVTLSVLAEAWYYRIDRFTFEETYVYPITDYPPPHGNGKKVTLSHRYQARHVFARLMKV